MKKTDLAFKTRIKDTDWSIRDYSFGRSITANNMIYVSDFLDKDKVEEYKKRLRRPTKVELEGFIDLIRFYYLSEPMSYISLLDEKCIIYPIPSNSNKELLIKSFHKLAHIGLSKRDIGFIINPIIRNQGFININNISDYTYYDLLKFSLPYTRNTSKKVTIILQAYEEQYSIPEETQFQMIPLKEEEIEYIELLKTQYDMLEKQQEEIQATIEHIYQSHIIPSDKGNAKVRKELNN